jgi:predicted AlkP superfamily phosphohydrolase/phosphomutase
MSGSKNLKVLVIGLDGATFDLIMPWLKGGELPNLGKIMADGVYGELESVIPPLSAPAWVSFATGKNPGKHGVVSFREYPDKPFKEISSELVNSQSFEDLTLWELLSQAGVKVGVINVPVTYPPPKVNGFLISSFLTPPSSKDFTYPPRLKDEIPDYRICIEYDKLFFFSGKRVNIKKYREGLFEEQCDVSERRTSTALKLLKSWNPEFFMIVYKGTDDMQHFFWDRRDVLLKYYKIVDGMIGRILESINEDTTVIVLSDHGFGPAPTRVFYLNTWLCKLGFLKMKKGFKGSFYRIIHIMGEKGKHLVNTIGINVPKKAAKKVMKKARDEQIDWKNSLAWGESSGIKGIYILLKDGERGNKVSKEYEEVERQIIEELQKLVDPETGEKIVSKVYKKEEIYNGPYLDKIPDIVFITNPNYAVNNRVGNKIVDDYSPRNPGGHLVHLNGILIVKGPYIKKGEKIEGARLIDITPTVLHLLGIPILEDMDGRVLKEIFIEGSEPSQREIRYQSPPKKLRKKKHEISKEESELLKDRLRALGYLS